MWNKALQSLEGRQNLSPEATTCSTIMLVQNSTFKHFSILTHVQGFLNLHKFKLKIFGVSLGRYSSNFFTLCGLYKIIWCTPWLYMYSSVQFLCGNYVLAILILHKPFRTHLLCKSRNPYISISNRDYLSYWTVFVEENNN